MNKDQELESLQFSAGKRTYFIDVKQSSTESKYLKICESKKIGENEFDRYTIMVFEENYHEFVNAILSLKKYFNKDNSEKSTKQRNNDHEDYTNAYKPWSETEDLQLTELYNFKTTTKEISKILHRTMGAINSRIKKLELKEKY